jgi:plastocyanin
MTRRLVAAALGCLFLASPAGATDRIVSIPGKFFVPNDLTALVGDTVMWRNEDSASHDVASFDDVWDSGLLAPGSSFSFALTEQGTFRYECTIHRFMFGVLRVFGLALSGPDRSVPAGGAAVLTGLAPAGSGTVAIEQEQPDGGFVAVASTPAGADGSFRAVLRPTAPARYRATTQGLSSDAVQVTVGALIELSAARSSAGYVVRARTSPSQAGATVVLERYARELFTWVPVARARLNGSSRTSFAVSPRRKVHFRAVIPRGVRGFGPAVSAQVVVRPS